MEGWSPVGKWGWRDGVGRVSGKRGRRAGKWEGREAEG